MTISYSRNIATSSVGTLVRLLFRWKGSIYKLLYRELIIFVTLYGIISLVYRIVLSADQRQQFEQFALFCERTLGMIPITFILGFYVSLVVGRWWNIFMNISYPDRLLLQVSTWILGTDERSRMSRRTIARYANLSQLLVFRDISSAARKRFPTLQHMVDTGFMTEEEVDLYEEIEMTHHKFWVPLQWICSLIYANRKEGRIENDQFVVRMMNEVLSLRTHIMTLLNYDWITVPLVYSQVVTIAVHGYFVVSLIGHQFLDPTKGYPGHEVDMYFPLFSVLQFIFYMGWLKVAESIMNPLGEDDDDFEVNYMVERNLRVAYAMADDNCMKVPPLKRDLYWNEPEATVPHTQESAGLKDNPHVPSAMDVKANRAELLSRKISTMSTPCGDTRNNGHIPSLARNGAKRSLRRVWSQVSSPFGLNRTHELDDLLEGSDGLAQPSSLGSREFPSSDDHPKPVNKVGRSVSVHSDSSRAPPKLFTVHEGRECEQRMDSDQSDSDKTDEQKEPVRKSGDCGPSDSVEKPT